MQCFRLVGSDEKKRRAAQTSSDSPKQDLEALGSDWSPINRWHQPGFRLIFIALHVYTPSPYLLLSSTGEAVFSPSWKDLAQKLKDSTVTQFLVPPLLLGSNEPKSKFNEPKSTTWGFANLPQLIVANDSSWKGTCDDNSLCRNDQSSAIGHMKHGGEGYEDQEGRGDWQGVCLGQADRKSPPAHHWARTRKTRWTNRWVLLNNETILDASLHHTAGAEIPILLAWGPYIHVACVKTGLCQRLKWISSAWQWAYFGSMLGHNLHNLWPKALCTETRNVNRVLPRQVEYQHES